jgi:hypothetical protein
MKRNQLEELPCQELVDEFYSDKKRKRKYERVNKFSHVSRKKEVKNERKYQGNSKRCY